MNKKKHWFAFSFQHQSMQTSIYLGYDTKLVSMPRIQAAKKSAGTPDDSVMVAVSYLGHMTYEAMMNLEDKEDEEPV